MDGEGFVEVVKVRWKMAGGMQRWLEDSAIVYVLSLYPIYAVYVLRRSNNHVHVQHDVMAPASLCESALGLIA